MVWRAGVNATEPIKSGLIFVDQRGCRTGIALANPSDQFVSATLILRNALGEELTRSIYTLTPRQQSALFLDELFPGMASDFAGPEPTRMLEPPGFLVLHYGYQTPLVTVAAHIAYGAMLGAFYRPD